MARKYIIILFNQISDQLKLNRREMLKIALIYNKILKSEKASINHLSLIAICNFYIDKAIIIEGICNIFKKSGHILESRQILKVGLKYGQYFKEESRFFKKCMNY